jgi:hypothetical protein
MSETKDIVFESTLNPLDREGNFLFGLTGAADKAYAMYYFMVDNEMVEWRRNYEKNDLVTSWEELAWGRENYFLKRK